MLSQYVGMPYSLRGKDGLNCWSLVALVYHDFFGTDIPTYGAKNHNDVSSAFTAAFTQDNHGFTKVDEPQDFDVIVMKNKQTTHCGVWFKGRVLHAHNGAKQVMFQQYKAATRNFQDIEFWRR